MCEVWSSAELTTLVLGTVALSTAGVLAIILLCVWLAQRGPYPTLRRTDTNQAPIAHRRAQRRLQQPAQAAQAEPVQQITEHTAATPAAARPLARPRRRGRGVLGRAQRRVRFAVGLIAAIAVLVRGIGHRLAGRRTG